MAHLNGISVGNFTKLFYDNGTAWAEVTEINTLPAPSDEATIVTVQEYGVEYQRQLVGSKTAGAIELVLNFNPSNASHLAIIALFGGSAPTRFYTEYTNSDDSASTYQTFSAFVSSRSLASDFDAGRAITTTLTPSGGLSNYTDTAPAY